MCKKYLAWGHHDESQARPSRFLYDMLRYESMKSAWWLLAVICSHLHTKRNLNNISKLGGFIFHLLLQADVKRAAENKSNPGSLFKNGAARASSYLESNHGSLLLPHPALTACRSARLLTALTSKSLVGSFYWTCCSDESLNSLCIWPHKP